MKGKYFKIALAAIAMIIVSAIVISVFSNNSAPTAFYPCPQ